MIKHIFGAKLETIKGFSYEKKNKLCGDCDFFTLDTTALNDLVK